MDWDAAAKRDYVAAHGAEPYWLDLPKPESLQTTPAKTKTGKALAAKALRSCKLTIELFRKLPQAEKVARARIYSDRIRQLCAAERAAVAPSRRRYAVAIDAVERNLIDEIERLARTRRKPKGPKPVPRKKQGLGPVLPEGRRKASRARSAKSNAKLPALQIEAAFTSGVLYASWDDHPDADSWQLIIRGRDRRIRRAVKLAEEDIATQLTGLPREHAPYELKIVAKRAGRTLATGLLKAIPYA
jgi:hypothetical protein